MYFYYVLSDVPVSCMHSTWFQPHASLHHNTPSVRSGSHDPNSLHSEDALLDLHEGIHRTQMIYLHVNVL